MTVRRSVVCFSLGGLLCAPAALPAAGQSRGRGERWVEVRSPNFVVVSNADEKRARSTADQFEQIRALFKVILSKARVDPGKPVIIFAVKDEKSLQALLPEYWEQKGLARPAGLFHPGEEKHHVVLRLDAIGENPFHVLYHEYVHLLNSLNFRRMPVWLDEGLADVFGNTAFTGKVVFIGKPLPGSLQLLRANKLIPLEAFLRVDHRSPYYQAKDKKSLFYAQAWTLAHYLMIADKMARMPQVNEFLSLLHQEVDELEAARRAFGDLKQLEKTLEVYIRQSELTYPRMKAPVETPEEEYKVRELSPAEAAARRGDFLVHSGRPNEAKPLLDEALRLDASLAPAHVSLGFLYYRQGALEDARASFARAVELDAQSYLAHYYHAMLNARGRVTPATAAVAEEGLRRAIELNPDFAPAHSVLAQFYAMRGERLAEALEHATRAAQLEPGTAAHHLGVAQVLLRMDRVEEAVRVARAVAASTRSDADRASAEAVLASAEKYLAEKTRYEQETRQWARRRAEPPAEDSARNTAPRPDLSRRDVIGGAPAGTAGVPRSEAAPAVTPPATAPGEGRLKAVACSGDAMDLTLELYGFPLKLHAEDRSKVVFHAPGWKGPGEFDPCAHLRGLDVKVEYKVVLGKPHAGEIVSVNVLSSGGRAAQQESKPAEPVATLPPALGKWKPGDQLAVFGVITSVTCGPPAWLRLTLDTGRGEVILYTEQTHKIEVVATDWRPREPFNPCMDLKGLTARISFTYVTGKPYVGTIHLIELRK